MRSVIFRSGGDVISYGVREALDIGRWESLLLATPGVERIYGIGQSMGAAILLESRAQGTRLRASVAARAQRLRNPIAVEALAVDEVAAGTHVGGDVDVEVDETEHLPARAGAAERATERADLCLGIGAAAMVGHELECGGCATPSRT